MKPRSHRPRYPLAAIAAYGPDQTRATKLVVSVFTRPGDRQPDDLRHWTVEAGDVRTDQTIAEEVAIWLKRMA